LSLVVSTDKVFLVLGELAGDGVGSVGGDETLRVGCDLLAGGGGCTPDDGRYSPWCPRARTSPLLPAQSDR
jgi:hypothetical protein